MSNRDSYLLALIIFGVLLVGLLYYIVRDGRVVIDEYNSIDRPARIHPDYTNTVIPPNIAPLNFIVQETGTQYYVKVYSKQGKSIDIYSRKPCIEIPMNSWKKLLRLNRGQKLYFDIYVMNDKHQWNRFGMITNKIANEDIDRYLLYRKIYTVPVFWKNIGIYQRDLANYNESAVIHNNSFGYGCVNCHSFLNNEPDKMLIGIRSSKHGSSAILVEGSKVNKIGTKFTYTSWHPSGRLVAYSFNKVIQFFHSARNKVREVMDLDSFLAFYLVDSKTVKTSPEISKSDRLETYPAWSPDGRYLYFCSAPILWTDRDKIPSDSYTEVKYDLMRASYDLNRDQWGKLETVLSAQDTGLSILQPRISPNGRWLLFCMCDYGSFPVYHVSSDLYLIDLKAAQQTGQFKYQQLEINSDQSESWHSWSSNSRWIVFSSKRLDGVFSRPYFSYVDKAGKVCKPVLLPQKDPTFYDFYIKTYSVPELVNRPVRDVREKVGRAVRGPREIPIDMPITMATPKAETSSVYERSWRELERE